MGYFLNPDRITVFSKARLYFLIVGILSYGLTEAGRFLYRPFIYQNGIDDFGIADSVGNWGGILVQIFIGCAILNPNQKQSYRLAGFFAGGYILYEFLQPYFPKGTFDWQDVYGTAFGFCLAVILLKIIWHLAPETHRYLK